MPVVAQRFRGRPRGRCAALWPLSHRGAGQNQLGPVALGPGRIGLEPGGHRHGRLAVDSTDRGPCDQRRSHRGRIRAGRGLDGDPEHVGEDLHPESRLGTAASSSQRGDRIDRGRESLGHHGRLQGDPFEQGPDQVAAVGGERQTGHHAQRIRVGERGPGTGEVGNDDRLGLDLGGARHDGVVEVGVAVFAGPLGVRGAQHIPVPAQDRAAGRRPRHGERPALDDVRAGRHRGRPGPALGQNHGQHRDRAQRQQGDTRATDTRATDTRAADARAADTHRMGGTGLVQPARDQRGTGGESEVEAVLPRDRANHGSRRRGRRELGLLDAGGLKDAGVPAPAALVEGEGSAAMCGL